MGVNYLNFELCTIPLEITLTVVKVLVATLNVNIHPIYSLISGKTPANIQDQ